MSEKAAIFIDGGYLDKVLKHEHGSARVDYDKLATEMASGLTRFRAYYYHCRRWQPPNPTDADRLAQKNQDRFLERIGRLPNFEVRLGQLKVRGKDDQGQPIFQQKGVDVFLAVDVMRVTLRKSADTIVLLAGDGDYIPLMRAAKDEGLRTRLYHAQLERAYARDLWNACDDREPMVAALVDRIRRA
jgi:uncharacterized LabA/DUF88 family protein